MFPLNLPDSVEHREYLRGVMFSDPDYRKDPEVDIDMIDPYGTGNKAFWRGVLEGGGYIGLPNSRGQGYPRIELHGAAPVLLKFIEFIGEENSRRCGVNWKWDSEGKLAWQANGGFVRVTGQRAVEVTLALYHDQTVGRASCRRIADGIVAWSPRS